FSIPDALGAPRPFSNHAFTDCTLLDAKHPEGRRVIVSQPQIPNGIELMVQLPGRLDVSEVQKLDLAADNLDPSEILRHEVRGAVQHIRAFSFGPVFMVDVDQSLPKDIEEATLEVKGGLR